MQSKPLIIALDFSNASETIDFLNKFYEPLFVKIGMELFYKEGKLIIDRLKKEGHHIFLDLKLHDIPNTIKSAMRQLAALGVDLINVHAAGGRCMMEAALEGLSSGTPPGQRRPVCIAVTQLTSTSQHMMTNELLIDRPLDEVVLSYAQLAAHSGMDGVVCSVHEVTSIHTRLGKHFFTITPGIRPQEGSAHDQVRVATPELACQLQADAIVVGRAITRASDPYKMYKQLLQAWRGNDRDGKTTCKNFT